MKTCLIWLLLPITSVLDLDPLLPGSGPHRLSIELVSRRHYIRHGRVYQLFLACGRGVDDIRASRQGPPRLPDLNQKHFSLDLGGDPRSVLADEHIDFGADTEIR